MSYSVVFAGSPQVAVPYLDALVNAGIEIRAVITREDAPVGRKKIVTPTPVALRAEQFGIPVIKANSLKDVRVPDSEVGIVVAYGGLVPQRLLDQPAHGWLNVHFSRLPQWRGAAPVQRAVMAGEDTIGLSIFRLVASLDAGPVAHISEYPVDSDSTASEILEDIARSSADLLVSVANSVADGSAVFVEQVGEPSYAHKLDRNDGRVDWTRSSRDIHAQVRGVTDEPGAFTSLAEAPFGIVRCSVGPELVGAPGAVTVHDGQVLVHCGAGSLVLTQVKPAGKGVMLATDWARGLRGAVQFV